MHFLRNYKTRQDRAYLSEFLLKKNYKVHGLNRRSPLLNTNCIDHLCQDPHVENRNFILHYGDLTIKVIAETIQKIVKHTGKIIWDSSKPDGTPRKLIDVSKMTNAGWRCLEHAKGKAKISVEEGIKATY